MTERKQGLFKRLFKRSRRDGPEPIERSVASPSAPADLAALRDAMLPQELGEEEYQIISPDRNPEEFAKALIRPTLPRVFFDQIDLSTDVGKAQLLASLVTRPNRASLEKDEIIRFVDRNRSLIPELLEQLLPAFKRAADNTDKSVSTFIDYFDTQVRFAFANEADKIDVKSDQFLWLVYALASHVESDVLSYDSALAYLRKPVHFDRISGLTLRLMLIDYASSIGTPSQPSLVYVMLIGEAGRMKGIGTAASAAFAVVTKSNTADRHGNILRFVTNLEPFLIRSGRFDDEFESAVRRIRGRFDPALKPDDF